ncbi:MAG: hypothetical protein LBS42_00465 [Tannerella sp.]|nr:hypothetical protein [Tannerella sp.]
MNQKQKLAVLNLFGRALLENKKYDSYYTRELLKFGVVCSPFCDYNAVFQYVVDRKINPDTTFYTTIEEVTFKTRLELFVDQVLHYASTYGTDFRAKPFIINDTPVDLSGTVVIDTITELEAVERCQNMLYSGMALSQETIENILLIIESNFDIDGIKNREALCLISVKKDVYPSGAEDIVRVLVYRATGKSLLIKDRKTLKLISQSHTIIPIELAGKLSEVFYRFKDIFISFKTNPLNRHTVNRIRKLAAKNHKPFVTPFWSTVLSAQKDLETIEQKAEELNSFRKIAILNAIRERIHNSTNVKPYIIRNGKLWIDINVKNSRNVAYLEKVFDILYQSLIRSAGKNKCEITLPEHLTVMAPVSEKKFMGEIPIYSFVELKNDVIIGINWKEKDGARDLDLSMIDSEGRKIGWDAEFYDDVKSFVYSGDMTTANPEATELLYRREESDGEGIVSVNGYYLENEEASFKVFFAMEKIEKGEPKRDYMVNPENIIFQYETNISDSEEKQLGVFVDSKFIFASLKTSDKRISEKSITDLQLVFMKQIHKHLLTLEQILADAGFTVTKEKNCIMSKDTVIKCLY